MNNDFKYNVLAWVFGLSFLSAIILGLMFGLPVYKVWSAHKHGQAEFAKAEQNRRISVLEAQAKKDSATLLGEAEVARAHGFAEANEIVASSLGGHDNYIKYLWIQQIDKIAGQIIYVPTEAGLPITEAGKR